MGSRCSVTCWLNVNDRMEFLQNSMTISSAVFFPCFNMVIWWAASCTWFIGWKWLSSRSTKCLIFGNSISPLMSGPTFYTRISNFCRILHFTTTYGSASYWSVVLIALSASIRLHPSHTQFPMHSYQFIHFNAQFSAHIHQESCALRTSLWISAHPRLGPKHCLIWN